MTQTLGSLVANIAREAAKLELQNSMVWLAKAWAAGGNGSDADVAKERQKAAEFEADLAVAVAAFDQAVKPGYDRNELVTKITPENLHSAEE